MLEPNSENFNEWEIGAVVAIQEGKMINWAKTMARKLHDSILAAKGDTTTELVGA